MAYEFLSLKSVITVEMTEMDVQARVKLRTDGLAQEVQKPAHQNAFVCLTLFILTLTYS